MDAQSSRRPGPGWGPSRATRIGAHSAPGRSSLDRARLIALATPLLLAGGALLSQYAFGLYPCEMCHWQRWPHYAAIPLAALAIALRNTRAGAILLALATVAILTSGVIGAFHAGVEYGWWTGLTTCSSITPIGSGADMLRDLMAAPMIRCDQAQWSLGGVSLAGFNAIFSIGAVVAIVLLVSKARRA